MVATTPMPFANIIGVPSRSRHRWSLRPRTDAPSGSTPSARLLDRLPDRHRRPRPIGSVKREPDLNEAPPASSPHGTSRSPDPSALRIPIDTAETVVSEVEPLETRWPAGSAGTNESTALVLGHPTGRCARLSVAIFGRRCAPRRILRTD
jgi:hypothetical protein